MQNQDGIYEDRWDANARVQTSVRFSMVETSEGAKRCFIRVKTIAGNVASDLEVEVNGAAM